jgi:hypothetical protein
MHKIVTGTVCLSILSIITCGSANAAYLQILPASTPHVQSIYLNGENLNGNSEVIIFKATPDSVRVQLLNTLGIVLQDLNVAYSLDNAPLGPFANLNGGFLAGAPRPVGQASTYYNRMLDADPFDFPGALGWTVWNVVRTSSELSFVGEPLGGKITTAKQPGGLLFLANLYAPSVPEPTTFGLLSVAVLALAGLARR